MKVVILAGGMGTRMAEETESRPKPMVEIGGRPIVWHIMKLYSHFGFNEFIICLGYKGYAIKEYFLNYFLHSSDVTIDLASGATEFHDALTEPWKVTLVDTGLATNTGGRIKRIGHLLEAGCFLCTYGDGVGDVDIAESVRAHEASGALATMTIAEPPARFGAVVLDGERVTSFAEKAGGDGLINAGFFVMDRAVVNHIDGDSTMLEHEPLERLARNGQLNAYRHRGFWHPMDTPRDKRLLQEKWDQGAAPWRVWEREG